MSTAHWRLKSFQSLSSTSPTKDMAMVLLTPHPVCSMLMGPPYLRKGYFKRWTWISKAAVMGVVTGQSHIVGPLSNWFAAFTFHINRPTIQNKCQKIDRKFILKKMPQKCPTKFPPNWTMNKDIWLLSFVVIGWEVLTLSYTQANFVNQCTNHDLGLKQYHITQYLSTAYGVLFHLCLG